MKFIEKYNKRSPFFISEDPRWDILRSFEYEKNPKAYEQVINPSSDIDKEAYLCFINKDKHGVEYLVNEESQLLKKVLLKAPQDLQGDYQVESGTEIISCNAFHNCKGITTVTLPEGLKIIGDGAFRGCDNLQPVTIPSSVEYIGTKSLECKYNIFVLPKELNDIDIDTLPEADEYRSSSSIYKIINGCLISKTKLYKYLGKGTTEVQIPDDVVLIGDNAFSENQEIKKVLIPSTVTTIGIKAFTHCEALETVKIFNGVEKIAGDAFSHCISLKKIVIPDSVTQIGDYVFNECTSLEEVKLPNELRIIQRCTFCDCVALKSIIFPSSIEKIESNAFENCGLERVNISRSVNIENNAFLNCRNLLSINAHSSYRNAFNGCPGQKYMSI